MFDIDGVVYDGHSILDIIQDQVKVGFVDQSIAVLVEEEVASYKSGIKSYEEAANSILYKWAYVLKGKKYNEVLEYNHDFLKNNKSKFFEYFLPLVKELKKKADIFFVTANFQFTTEAFSKYFGIEKFLCSQAEVVDGVLSGNVLSTLAGNKGVVSELVNKKRYTVSIAVGDSENDIDMLRNVTNPVAFEPNDKLKGFASENGWLIVERSNAYNKLLNLV